MNEHRHGLRAVRLSEVPVERRLQAAREESRRARDSAERQALLCAALWPSDRVYWIRAAA